MKRTRFYLALLASLCVLLITACTKGGDPFEYYFLFGSYFVPRGVNENSLYHGTYSISLTTLPSNYITADDDGKLFRTYALEYGEYGKKRIRSWYPALKKPINIIGMRVYQREGTDEKDVSQYFEISFWDCSSYISSGYSDEYNIPTWSVQKRLTDLSEHDLEWMSDLIALTPDLTLDTAARYTLKIALKGGKELVVQLSNKH